MGTKRIQEIISLNGAEAEVDDEVTDGGNSNKEVDATHEVGDAVLVLANDVLLVVNDK